MWTEPLPAWRLISRRLLCWGGGVGPGPALFGTRIPPGAARGTRLPERGGAQGGGEGVELAWECGK